MICYNNKNIVLAKNLRKNLTPWERKLWFEFLKNYPIKFYKQKPIGNYIIDFYCDKAKLAIELDGSQHYSTLNKQKDLKRTKYLNQLNILVLRYSNLDVDKNFEDVCSDIITNINLRLQTSQSRD